jgi:hypothetical protein
MTAYDEPVKKLLTIAVVVTSVAACSWSSPSPPLPPLIQNARTTGGTNALCDPGVFEPGSEGTTPDTVSHSPEIVSRLKRDYPPGSLSEDLEHALIQMGFKMIPCRGALAARFDQKGGNGITSMPATAVIIWKADEQGRILWTAGDIAYTGL